MRIISLKMENLNAVKGKWTIDFTNPAYTNEGVFAITGPTGAGKTTILDAICLALYGITPRLSSVNSNNNDIMNRQSSYCSAEVEFESKKGIFRVSWQQSRARKDPQGKLQAAKHEICEAQTGIIIEDKLSKTTEVVIDKLGMTFEQFTRAVLLAQGQFSVFLQADSKRRSELLEQITGTKIYSLISIKVSERRKLEEDKLHYLQATITNQQPLDEEMLRVLQVEHQNYEQSEKRLKTELTEWQAYATHHENIAQYQNQLEQAAIEAGQIEAEELAFAAKLKQKMRHKQTEAGFEIYHELLGLRQQSDKSSQAITKIYQDCEALTSQYSQQQEVIKVALAVQQREQSMFHDAQEKVERAKVLDRDLRHQQEIVDFAQSQLQELIQPTSLPKGSFETLSRELSESRLQLLKLLGNSSYQELNDRLQEMGNRYLRLENLAKTKEASEKNAAKLSDKQKQLAECQQQLVSLEKAVNNKKAAAKTAADFLKSTDSAKRFAGRIANFTETRHLLLENGEPCPLCGSMLHPYATEEVQQQIDEANLYYQNAQNAFDTVNAQFQDEKDAQNLKLAEVKSLTNEVLDRDTVLNEQRCELISQAQDLDIALDKITNELELMMAEGKVLKERVHKARSLQQAIDGLRYAIEWQKYQVAQSHFAQIKNQRQQLFSVSAEEHAQIFQKKLEKANDTLEAAKDRASKIALLLAGEQGQKEAAEQADKAILQALEDTQKRFSAFLSQSDFIDEMDYQASRLVPEIVAAIEQEEKLLISRIQQHSFIKKNVQQALATLKQSLPDKAKDSNAVKAKVLEIDLQHGEVQRKLGEIAQKLGAEAILREKHAAQIVLIEQQLKECRKWRQLHELIGSTDGTKFRNFAQGITFDLMIEYANRELAKISDRYQLISSDNDKNPLSLDVIDNYQAGEIRTTKNLSGGEGFIVSLALALGLAKMSGEKLRVDSLFLDEGFGTLDEDTLDVVLSTLSNLHQEGKMIGMISHVASIQERIATQIQVIPQSGGFSKIIGPGVTFEHA